MIKQRSIKKKTGEGSDDFLSQFQSGTALSSDKTKKALEKQRNIDAAKVSEVHDDPLFSESYDIDKVLVEYFVPEKDNPRYLPVEFAKDDSSEALAALTNCVVCEKGVIENRLVKTNPQYEEVQKEIASIKELALSIKEEGLVQPISVWKMNTTHYKIIAGHRRYYAVRFLYGTNIKIRCKVHAAMPKRMKLIRHLENMQRKDLSPPDALKSFNLALSDLTEELAGLSSTARNERLCEMMGIANTTRFRYEKLNDYYEEAHALLTHNIFKGIRSGSEFIQACEDSNSDKDAIRAHLSACLEAKKLIPMQKPKVKKASAKKYYKLPKIKVEHSKAVKRLLTEDITKLDIGLAWEEIDYDDPAVVEDVLSKVFSLLAK